MGTTAANGDGMGWQDGRTRASLTGFEGADHLA